MSFPEKDSFYGQSYVMENGVLTKTDPTPGRENNFTGAYTVPNNIVKCYKLSNTDSSRAFLLKGRVSDNEW